MKFTITVKSLNECILSPKYPELEKFLMSNMKVVRKGYEYIEDVNDYIKYIYFYDNKKCSFGYGYVDRVRFLIGEFMSKYAKKIDYSVDVIDERRRARLASSLPDKLVGVTLRPYQLRGVDLMEPKNSAVCRGSTGCGKTLMFAELIRRKNVPTLVLTSGKGLVDQNRNKIESLLGRKVGLIKGKTFDIRAVTVASVNTLNLCIENYKKYLKLKKTNFIDKAGEKFIFNDGDVVKWKNLLKYLNNVVCVVVDECHHVVSTSYRRVLNNMKNVKYSYGFSGTPSSSYSPYKAYVHKYCGAVCVNISEDYLIKNGYLSKPFFYFIDLPEGNWEEHLMNYNQVYQSYIVENEYRNTLICSIANILVKDGLVLILTDRIEHTYKLDELLKYTDINYEIQTGKYSTEKHRSEVIDKMKGDKLQLVISTTGIIGEGIDIPNIKTLILAGAGKALVLKTQQVGRALRLFSDNKVKIISFINHDLSSRRYLYAHSKEFLKMMRENNEYIIKIMSPDEFNEKIGDEVIDVQKRLMEWNQEKSLKDNFEKF